MLLNTKNQNGVALTIVVIVLIIMGILSAYAMNLGYNQRRMQEQASGRRIKIYYRAQAGAVNAMWRIRSDVAGDLTPAGTFTNAAYNPNTYLMDIDGDGVNDTSVDIGPLVGGQRAILSTGLDV